MQLSECRCGQEGDIYRCLSSGEQAASHPNYPVHSAVGTDLRRQTRALSCIHDAPASRTETLTMTTYVRLLSILAMFSLALGLGLSGATAVAQPKEAATTATKWDYKSVQLSLGATTKDMDKAFNELGEQGWEMATSNTVAHPGGGGLTNYIFKRAKR